MISLRTNPSMLATQSRRTAEPKGARAVAGSAQGAAMSIASDTLSRQQQIDKALDLITAALAHLDLAGEHHAAAALATVIDILPAPATPPNPHAIVGDRPQWFKCLAHPRLEWSLLHTFAIVVECGAFRAGAIKSSKALNTVRARVRELERISGRSLVGREPAGVTLTEAGRDVFHVVTAMRSARDEAIEGLADRPHLHATHPE